MNITKWYIHNTNKIHLALLSVLFITSLVFAPLFIFAQTTTTSSAPVCGSLFSGNINNLKDIVDYVTCLLTKSIVPLLFVLTLVFFVYGVIQYFIHPDSIKERENAKKYIVWALVGMFVIFSIAGIIEILRNTFGVTGNPIPLLPETQ